MDIYAIVTEKIINLLESGVVPWRKPWTSTGMPRNLISKRPYRGINCFPAFGVEVRFAVLADLPAGERTWRTRAQRRRELNRGFLEGRRRGAEG